MKAYRIDPVARTVTEVEYSGDYKQIYDLLSDEIHDIDTYDVVRLYRNGDGAFVDDEGLFKPCGGFWMHANYPEPIAGPGLVLGCDEEGESIAPQTPIEEVRAALKFFTREELVRMYDEAPAPF